MHMSDALLSPTVGLVAGAMAAGVVAWSARTTERGTDPGRAPLMGVLGAFVFAAQMVNFSIPGTGSSGHLGGGLLLATLLGPAPAFLVITSVLVVQALLFADGGLLALGCNVLNLGLWTCFVAYPLVLRPLAGPAPGARRLGLACTAAAVVGLELGALSVVIETTLSGIAALPFGSFSVAMLLIHLAIGLVEGLVTAAIVLTVRRARPDLMHLGRASVAPAARMRPVLLVLASVALMICVGLVGLASTRPDGLEWSINRVAETTTSLLPDHALARAAPGGIGTRLSGLLGAIVTLLLTASVGVMLRLFRPSHRSCSNDR